MNRRLHRTPRPPAPRQPSKRAARIGPVPHTQPGSVPATAAEVRRRIRNGEVQA